MWNRKLTGTVIASACALLSACAATPGLVGCSDLDYARWRELTKPPAAAPLIRDLIDSQRRTASVEAPADVRDYWYQDVRGKIMFCEQSRRPGSDCWSEHWEFEQRGTAWILTSANETDCSRR